MTPPTTAPRPATVTVAFALQVALVGTLLLMIATAVAGAIRYDGLIGRAARAVGASAADVSLERSMNLSGTLGTAVPALVLAVWLGVAAVWVRRGSNIGRILSLVGLGLPLVLGLVGCLLGGLLGGVFLVGMLAGPPDEFLAEEEFTGTSEMALYEELARLDSGGWSIAFEVTGMAAVAVALLLGVATGILLLTGPSDRFFRPWRQPPAPVPPWPVPYPPPFWYGPPAPPYPPAAPPPPWRPS